jgi:hypothetical protein
LLSDPAKIIEQKTIFSLDHGGPSKANISYFFKMKDLFEERRQLSPSDWQS